MKININVTLKEMDGSDMIHNVVKKGEESVEILTFKNLLGIISTNILPGEVISPEQKSKLFGIGVKCYSGDEVDFTDDENSLILERVDKFYPSPITYGRVKELLEGNQQFVPLTTTEPITSEIK